MTPQQTPSNLLSNASKMLRNGMSPDNRIVRLERKGQLLTIVLRQMPHDEPAIVGRKLRYGSGAMWTVLDVA